MSNIPFIDRDEELSLTQSMVNAWGTRRILCINAVGGIGKTRLLQEVYQVYRANPVVASSSSPSKIEDAFPERQVKVAVVHKLGSNSWDDEFNRGLESMCAELGAKSVVLSGDFTVDMMPDQIEFVLESEHPDALIISLGYGELVRRKMYDAVNRGVKVLTLANNLFVEGMSTAVEMNDYELALRSLNRMIEDLDGQGDIAVILAPGEGFDPMSARRQVLKLILDRYPNINVVADYGEEATEAIEESICETTHEILDKNPNLRAVWAAWDLFAIGASKALVEAGRVDIPVYGIDITPEDVQLMIRPDYPWKATAAVDPFEAGRIMARLAIQAVYGEQLHRHYALPVALIDQDTLHKIPERQYLSKEYVNSWGESYIGWKSWMIPLQDKYLSQSRARRLVVTGILDFDEAKLRSAHGLFRYLANSIDVDAFSPFMSAFQDWRLIEEAGVSRVRIQKELNAVYDTFAQCFNAVSEHQRILLLWDTLETLSKDTIHEVASVLSRLTNYVLIAAGRNARALYAELKSQDEAVEIIELMPFTEESSTFYLEEKQRQLFVSLDAELTEKLAILSAGRPILLDLAVDWLARDVPLPWLENISIEEFRNLDETKRSSILREFESHLVSRITGVREEMDRLLLTMSHIQPVDSKMLSVLIGGLSDEEINRLMMDATAYATVKVLPNGKIMLHDEMTRLIKEYVWDEIDGDGQRRKYLSSLAINICNDNIIRIRSQINLLIHRSQLAEGQIRTMATTRKGSSDEARSLALELELSALRDEQTDIFLKRESLENELWVYAEQMLYHAIASSDINEAAGIFVALFDEAYLSYRFSTLERLLDLIYPYNNRLSGEMKHKVFARYSKYLMDLGRFNHAEDVLNELLAENKLSAAQRIETLILLGNTKIRLGDVREGISKFDEAEALCLESKSLDWLIKAKNAKGWAYRLIGDWKLAIDYYQQAKNLCLEAGSFEDDYGWILINLTFALSYHNRERAIEYGNLALEYWNNKDNEIGFGAAHSSLGSVYYQAGYYEKALESLGKALSVFEKLNHQEWMGIVYSWRGATYQDLGDTEAALDDLKKSLQLAPRQHDAMTLNRLGRVYMSMRDWGTAEKYISQSYQRSKEIPDSLYQLGSLARLFTIAAETKRYQELPTFVDQLDKYLAEVQHPDGNSLGIAYFALGRLALGRIEIEDTIEFLTRGIICVANYGSYAHTSLQGRLRYIERDFNQFDPAIIRRIGGSLLEFFKEQDTDVIESPYGALVDVLQKWRRWSEPPHEK